MNDIQFYKNNIGLKSSNQNISFTEDQIKEYIKCSQDPIYFIENYCKVVSQDDGVVLLKLYPYQNRLINAIHNNNRIIGRVGRQLGKCIESKSLISLRNKKTGEILEISIGDFFEEIKKGDK